MALKREWREELGVEVCKTTPWTFVYNEYEEEAVLLLFFYVEIEGEPAPQEGQKILWVTVEEAMSMNLASADAQIVELLSEK